MPVGRWWGGGTREGELTTAEVCWPRGEVGSSSVELYCHPYLATPVHTSQSHSTTCVEEKYFASNVAFVRSMQ